MTYIGSEKTTATITEWMVTVKCCNCSVNFAIPENLRENLLKTQREFFCPNGHRQWYCESTADLLRKELNAKELEIERAKKMAESMEQRANAYISENDSLRRSRSAVQGQLTKAKKRAANGVCPCCNRTVAQLARHVAKEHPEYLKAVNLPGD